MHYEYDETAPNIAGSSTPLLFIIYRVLIQSDDVLT